MQRHPAQGRAQSGSNQLLALDSFCTQWAASQVFALEGLLTKRSADNEAEESKALAAPQGRRRTDTCSLDSKFLYIYEKKRNFFKHLCHLNVRWRGRGSREVVVEDRRRRGGTEQRRGGQKTARRSKRRPKSETAGRTYVIEIGAFIFR